MRKAYPKKVKPLPTGVENIEGKLITNVKEKKNVILDHFHHRIRRRSTKEEVKEVQEKHKKIFEQRLEMSKQIKSEPFNMNELDASLKLLKTGKSRDPENLINDIFKNNVIGSDLKQSMLMMFNKMKDQTVIPESLRTATITMLHKKDSKLDLNNWRGIFVSSVLRSILMKMIHERTYQNVASNMTNAQIGAQKNKSVRDHIFILNSIISDVLSSVKKTPLDLSVMDYRQMFDSEEAHICLNAIYESGVQDDTFALLNEANISNIFAVKTPNGLTETRTISNKIVQGDVR